MSKGCRRERADGRRTISNIKLNSPRNLGSHRGLSQRLKTMLPSGQILAGAQCFLEASNFALSYISPNTMVDSIFTLRQPKDRSGILYMATFVGQHGFPWMVISGIYAAKGNVPAEYMLASTIASAFYALDITFRVTRVCEAQGVAKSSVIAGAPIYAILGVLSFLVYQSM